MNIVRILLTGLIYLPSIVGFIDNFHSLRKLERFRFREPLFSDFLDSYELPGPLKKFFETQRIETEIQNVVVNTTSLPIIAVIGRPNTGKSTLVNRICKHFQDGAIVHSEAGITRDRSYKLASFQDYSFQIVDTGGILFEDSQDIFAKHIYEQAQLALQEPNLKAVILVCDAQCGLTDTERDIARWLRKRAHVPIFVAANKCESTRVVVDGLNDFWTLGFGSPFPISAIHGNGINTLFEAIINQTSMQRFQHAVPSNITNFALLGRPNVGKSSLFNKLYGKNRMIVSDIAGTTRDAIDEIISRPEGNFRLIDTAGIRRKSKVEEGAEYLMVNRALKAIGRSDVVGLLLDATTGIVDQDRIIAQRISEEGRGCVILLNKWDTVANKTDKSYEEAKTHIRTVLSAVKWAEILLISAKSGQRTDEIFRAVQDSCSQFRRRITTSVLNEVVQDAVMWLAPPASRSRAGKIYYSIQVSVAPPCIVHFVNDPILFSDSYRRYLEHRLRESLKWNGTPLRFIFRKKTMRDIERDSKKGGGNILRSQRWKG